MENIANTADASFKVVEEKVVETTNPGFFGRFVRKYPKLLMVATAAAAGGAGYVAYNQLRDGADPEKVADTMEIAAAAIGRLRA